MIPRALRLHRAAAEVAFVFALVLTGLDPLAASGAEPGSITWRDDYGSALEEAVTANRPLWIQFTGPWCPNCTRMERDSFPHPAIVEHARESFVPVKLSCDVHEQLAHDFNLSGLPATVIVAPNREVVAVHQGYLGPAEFDTFLRESLLRLPARAATADQAAGGPAEKPPAGHQPQGPASDEHLALGGYCAVSLIRDRKLVIGQFACAVVHDGQTYRLASPALLDLFRADPDRYVPANNGSCPVAQVERGKVIPGSPRWGILYRGRLFVFASESDRRRFVSEPDRYAMVDVAEQGFCTHCIRNSGLLVRGDPRHEVARGGRRYWFPDASHREAFLTSLR